MDKYMAINFDDLGTDAIQGVELMRLLGLSEDDFIDDTRFHQFKDLISYFKDHPDTTYLINKLTMAKNVDKLTHIWEYTRLQKQKWAEEKDLDALKLRKNELTGLDFDEDLDSKIKDLNFNIENKSGEITKLTDQLNLYEK